MFVVKVYCKIETSPWALTFTEPVPEAFESPASDCFLMFPLTDPLKHIHSAIFLTPLQFVVQDWTYLKE